MAERFAKGGFHYNIWGAGVALLLATLIVKLTILENALHLERISRLERR